MNLQTLKDYIFQVLPLESEEWHEFSDLFKLTNLKKGELFAKQGRKETKIGFLINGVIRAYYCSSDGIEYNKTFFTDTEFFGAYTSLVSGNINQINLQALTDSQILVADYSAVVRLFDQYRRIETLARIISEQFYIEKERREIQLVLMDAEQRYEIFRSEYSGLEIIIPQYHIASYLGITPTQLSRIRAKIRS